MSLIHTITSTDTTILCTTRCGHSSMKHYFGIDSHNGGKGYLGRDFLFEDIRLINTEQVILCIRNPYDRLLSAVHNTNWLNKHGADMYTFNMHGRGWTESHSIPYLQYLVPNYNCITHLLQFDTLKHYIPISSDTFVSSVIGGVTEYEDWMSEYWTKSQMQSEYSAYCQLVECLPQITVEDWHLFTDKYVHDY
jgi:hypothetical protein